MDKNKVKDVNTSRVAIPCASSSSFLLGSKKRLAQIFNSDQIGGRSKQSVFAQPQ